MGWIGLIVFLTQPTMVGQKKFNPTPSLKSNPTQLNPYELGWVELNP